MVLTTKLQQLMVTATLNDLALVEHYDLVGRGDGGKAVAAVYQQQLHVQWNRTRMRIQLSGMRFTYAMVIVVRPAVTRSRAS